MPRTASERLAVSFALTDLGLQLARDQLRLEHPHATEAELAELFDCWRSRRPPDAPGRELDPAEFVHQLERRFSHAGAGGVDIMTSLI